MTHDPAATIIGFAGVALLLLAFLLNMAKLMRADGYVVLEGVWALVAAGAMVKKAAKARG